MTLKGYYFSTLKETNPQKVFRERVMAKAKISRSMFYNYINGNWPVPKDLQKIFAEEAGLKVEQLFPFTYHDKSKV